MIIFCVIQIIDKYVVDVGSIASTNEDDDFDIEVRKRSRAPRSMSMIPVAQGVDHGKVKGVDIRVGSLGVPDNVNEKESLHTGKGKEPVQHGAQCDDEATFFTVDFSRYNAGVSGSVEKTCASKSPKNGSVRVEDIDGHDQVINAKTMRESVPESTSFKHNGNDCSGGFRIKDLLSKKVGIGNESRESREFFTADGDTQKSTPVSVDDLHTKYSTVGSGTFAGPQDQHVFVPSVPPKIPISRSMIDDNLVGVGETTTIAMKTLVVAHEHLTDNYMKAIEEIKRKDRELEQLRARCSGLEENMNMLAVRLKSTEGHIERSETRVGMLLCLLDESRANTSELEKRCSVVDVADTVHSIIKSRSKDTMQSDAVDTNGVPSFKLNVTQDPHTNDNAASSRSNNEADERILELELENEKMKVTIEVLQHTNYDLITDKDREIQSLVDNNNRLEEEAERWRRGMDIANGEAEQLQTTLQRKRKELDEANAFNKNLMDQLIQIQTVNDELTIINRTL